MRDVTSRVGLDLPMPSSHRLPRTPASLLGLAALLIAGVLPGCDSGGAEVTPRPGEWEGDNVVFTVSAGQVRGWRLLGMYCQGAGGDSGDEAACLSHPRGSYEDAFPLGSAGFKVELDGLTLAATFVDETTATGTWSMDGGSCCSAEGRFESVHVRDLPPDPVDGGGDGGDGGGVVTPAPTGELMASAASLCASWNAVKADSTEPIWSGSTHACEAGDIDADGLARVLASVNLYRAMAGLPAVGHDAGLDALAQSCSLMMEAEQDIDHYPSDAWACFSEDGARGASSSNLATAPALSAVDLYMVDTGNESTLGHRRWILTNGLGPFGIGSTTGYSCLQVMGSTEVVPEPGWTAWPAPGYFPIQAYGDWGTLDDAGWSIHSYGGGSMAGAMVSVTSDGQELPVTVTGLAGGYGGSEAISILPDGWTMQVGRHYAVSVTGISPEIAYGFDVVDCALLR